MKGIILAGGTGTRLHPLTIGVSKQLMPVFDKPMIYYPLSTLMLAGCRDVLIITTPQDAEPFRRLLGDGHQFGMEISWTVQPSPDGLAQAFILGADHIGSGSSALVLGDNLFYGPGFGTRLSRFHDIDGASVFGYWVANPSAYGVVEFQKTSDGANKVVSLEEKPEHPRSHYAVPGLYFYDSTVVDRAATLKPSARGELEITDLNRTYLDEGKLRVELMQRGTAWLDTGTFGDLADAASYVRTVQERQGLLVGCPEEIAWRQGWLDDAGLLEAARRYGKSGYGQALAQLLSH